MVSFYDPIQKKEMTYHLDKNLLGVWDKLRGNKLIKQNEDRVYIVDGRERVGKSLFTFQQAKYLDPTFNVDRICFDPDDFLKKLRLAKKGQVVVFDEAFRGLSSKASQSKVNKKLVQAMMEMGQRNLIVFIVLPTIFLLEIYPAVLRSEALFHVYKTKDGRRAFRIYNYKKKAILYESRKRRGFDYSFPKTSAKGRFFNIYPIDKDEYIDKKEKSWMNFSEKEEEEGKLFENWRVIASNYFNLLNKASKLSQIEFCKQLKAIDIHLTQPNLSGMVAKTRKEGRIISYQAISTISI